jgi:UDP-N-acetylglucosamine 4,6-dehydratase
MKRILITGGNGFLGRHLGKKLKGQGYEVYLGSRNIYRNTVATFFSGCVSFPMDICHIESIRDVIVMTKPDIIVHAAANKYIDLGEKNPSATVDVNVMGSQNVIRAAIESGVEFVLGISTDKASPPVMNTYGLTKALMERMFCSHQGFACVRFGNLAWSDGSVLPKWKIAHKETKVIPATGCEMQKFFLSVDEATQMIQTIIENPKVFSGKVACKYGKSVKMKEILDAWIASYGGKWVLQSERPGERLVEYLVGESEILFTSNVSVEGEKFFIIDPNCKPEFPIHAAYSTASAPRLTSEEISQLIKPYEF